MPSILVYLGLIAAFVGFVCVLKPIQRIGLGTRVRGLIAMAIGLVLFFAGLFTPVRVIRVARPQMALDGVMPEFSEHEVHSIRVHATPERVYQSLQAVTPTEIRWFALLMWLRSPYRPATARAFGSKPMMTVLGRMGFRKMAEEPPHEIVMGGIGRFGRPRAGDREIKAPNAPSVGQSARISNADDFRAFDQPGYAKIVANFVVIDEGNGWSRVRTETRVLGTDREAQTRFAIYWRVIYPGSAIIRREWLTAIKRRAEGPWPGPEKTGESPS